MSSTGVPGRDDPRWGVVPLPEAVKEIRPQQWEATQRNVDAWMSGDDVVYFEGPTGSGKSLVADLSQREFAYQLKQPVDMNVVTTTKALQDQYADSFPYGHVLKGKKNYLTELGNVDEFGNPHRRKWSSITCADCTLDDDKCRFCTQPNFCQYQVAKRRARYGSMAILNTSYFLTDARYVGSFTGRKLTVIDEADLLEDELLNQIEIVMSAKLLGELRIEGPTRRTAGEDGKGCVAWASWIRNVALPALKKEQMSLPGPWMQDADPTLIAKWRRVTELKGKLSDIVADVAMGGWIYDGYEDGHVIFRPVYVEKYGSQLLWPTSEKFLIMSATILSADLMNRDLGGYLPYASIALPSVFPAANRPIYYCPVAKMSRKETERTGGRNRFEMMLGLTAVANKHPEDRILVHTVSYDLARYLHEDIQHLNRPVFIYTDSDGKVDALRQYKRNPRSILLAASMDRGIDLPDEMCRVMAVAKIPFKNIGDKRTNARLWGPGGNDWLLTDAWRTIIQQTGRGVRHAEDQAVTYILDGDFDRLWEKEYLAPQYWKDAIDWRKSSAAWLMS